MNSATLDNVHFLKKESRGLMAQIGSLLNVSYSPKKHPTKPLMLEIMVRKNANEPRRRRRNLGRRQRRRILEVNS